MPANTSVNLTAVDFDEIKSNLKTYLKNQEVFKDYDFEASNISVLLDILAYNTQHNAFYLNMIGNEMFLDSAILPDSVVSHAKELNYLPRSFRSAKAIVDITIVASDPTKTSITIPKGTSFTARLDNKNYTFVTDQNIVVASSNGTFLASGVEIYEGDYTTDSYVIDYNSSSRYLITNRTVDTTSINVIVIEDNGETTLQYLKADSLFGLDSNSKVFFVQSAENGKYEIVFGDGVVGRRPKDRSIIVIEYRAGNGELPNGLSRFTSDGAIDGETSVSVLASSAASGGSVSESIESIKFNAPRAFTTQERAVTAKDYETLLRANFAEINEVVAFGGEEADPPRYGKVIVSIDFTGSDTLPPSKRDVYSTFLKQRSALSIDPVFIDPVFTYVRVKSKIKYDINKTALNEQDIKTRVISKILDYNDTNLSGFNKSIHYSKFIAQIDAAQSSIISNDTKLEVIKTISPIIGRISNIDIDFGVALRDDIPNLGISHNEGDINIVSSSSFQFKNKQCFLEDDGDGIIMIMTDDNGTHKIVQEVGTVDYSRGFMQLKSFKVDGYIGNKIKIYAKTAESDISTNRNTIMSILEEDVEVTVAGIRGNGS